MPDAITVSSPISGAETTLSFSAGKLAPQADGAVVAQIGNSMVLVTAVAAKSVREGVDFFPLTVDIEERMYAAGKIPGSFFRREGRATDQAILTCRLIDRPLRPSFPEGFRNEVHVVGTVLAADQQNPYDVLAINGASAALMLSGIPFNGPVGAVRVAYTIDGTWIPHPTYQAGDEGTFEMVVAGRALDDGDVAIMMVEAGGTEASWPKFEEGAPKITEAVLAEGLEQSKQWIRESIELQLELVAKMGSKPPMDFVHQADYSDEIGAAVDEVGHARIAEAMGIAGKQEREEATTAARSAIVAELLPRFADDADAEKMIGNAVRSLVKKVVRKRIVDEGFRIDGRRTDQLRTLSAEVGLLPTAHGSALFERGETQVLNVATLGMPRMEQMLDTIGIDDRKRYLHHYNFPPYSTGETGFMRGPKRREIGHGMLAERALLPVIPTSEDFPYTLRLVSEALSSNGSTSMASVCSSSMSLMDAGVPIKAPVAGVAMGLVHAEGKYTTLTDILGAEDAYGDMDFKVAGTADSVTALQLDTKINGIPAEVLAQALEQAHEARMQILAVMEEAIAEPRSEVRETAPKIVSFQIPIDKVGEVIGPKGKVINAIQQETGAEIGVDDDGMVGIVSIGSSDGGAVAEARRQIELILNPPTAEVGQVYAGKVVNITKFGAFVNILPGRDGLVHISKLGGGRRLERVEDVLSLGDELEVRVDDIDPNGKVSLTPVGDLPGGGEGGDGGGAGGAGGGSGEGGSRGGEYVSFEDSFDATLREEFGDLGPVDPSAGAARSGEGGREGGGRRREGRGGGGQRRRR